MTGANNYWKKFLHAISDEGWEEMWTDLNPWVSCASTWEDGDGEESRPEIPKVVSICYSENRNDDISDICENRHYHGAKKTSRRSLDSQTTETHPSTDSSEIFVVKRRRSKKNVKRRFNLREAPPLPESPKWTSSSRFPSRTGRRRSHRSLSEYPTLERNTASQCPRDIPRHIYVRPFKPQAVQHFVRV